MRNVSWDCREMGDLGYECVVCFYKLKLICVVLGFMCGFILISISILILILLTPDSAPDSFSP